MLRDFSKLPKYMQNDKVKYYYDILKKKRVSLFLKRLFDLLFSLILLIVLSPIFIILMILIKIDSKGPVFYKQERVTRYGKIFKIFKFRTMIVDADKKGSLVTLNDDQRITKIGKKIRKIRLDELPQLFNILLGDMSFVGTRPEVKKYVDCYTEEMYATLLMKAGVTSTASIEYKDEDEVIAKHLKKNNNIDDIYIKHILPNKMKYNLEYLKKFNIFLDIKICINTILKVGK